MMAIAYPTGSQPHGHTPHSHSLTPPDISDHGSRLLGSWETPMSSFTIIYNERN